MMKPASNKSVSQGKRPGKGNFAMALKKLRPKMGK